jgi:hypothetical protein
MGKERTKVNPDRQRQRYNREFKLEAVRLLKVFRLTPFQPPFQHVTDELFVPMQDVSHCANLASLSETTACRSAPSSGSGTGGPR